MLYPNKKITAIQLLHFAFPLLIFIGVLPDLLLADQQKAELLDAYYQHNNALLLRPAGIIPAGLVQPVSIGVGILYGVSILVFIHRLKKKMGSQFCYLNKQILIWLNLLTITITAYFLLQLYQYLGLLSHHNFDPPSQIIKCSIIILLCTYFISTPNVQENMDGCIIPKEKEQKQVFPLVNQINPILLPEFFNNELAKKIDQHIKESQCFLTESCDLNSMAKILDLNSTKLSNYIRQFYGVTYSEYINRLKIYHFLTHFNHFGDFTFETYIYQSGFKNRSTFYTAFKKYIGVNPSFYLKEFQHKVK